MCGKSRDPIPYNISHSGIWPALQRGHLVPDQHGQVNPRPDPGGAAQGKRDHEQGRDQGGRGGQDCWGHATQATQVTGLFMNIVLFGNFLRRCFYFIMKITSGSFTSWAWAVSTTFRRIILYRYLSVFRKNFTKLLDFYWFMLTNVICIRNDIFICYQYFYFSRWSTLC